MARINNLSLPQQRLSYSKKTKEWRKDNIDYADKHSFYHNESVRKSLKNKITNLNLYNGIVDIRDLKDVVNPYQMDASYIGDNIPHHPIAVPKIDLLVGEEMKRRFDYKVMVTNHNAVSEKEESKKEELIAKMTEYITNNYSEEEAEQKFEELEKYMKYDWQDVRERLATQILKHYSAEQNFNRKFNDGFKDALIMAEEIYQIDIVHDEPVLEKLNPLKVHAIRSGNSHRIEDSGIIILEDHWSPGKIIDYFHDQLKPKEIDHILEYTTTKTSGTYADDQNNHTLLRDGLDGIDGQDTINTIFNIAEVNGHYFASDYTDENGNIRVLRVYWRSLKKIKKVKFYDEFGEENYKIMSEEYIPNKELGEEATDLWVNEWWEGTKIGKDIYIQMRPRKVQYNKLTNPSYCHPGIVGEIYNTNQGKAVSLMDRMKNYQYLYDVIWDRLNKAIATNYGKIFELDLAKVPDNWEIDKWMHFAVTSKIAVVDSFKEGNKGASTGKLAGGMNTVGGRAIDMETGNYIQQHINLLEFIKMEMGEIAGVSKQREGQISNRETVGGVERSVNQSSHITEFWFQRHEDVKLRALEIFLETAKIALKGNNKKVQYLLDDQTLELLNMEGDDKFEADFGLVLTNTSKAMELEQAIKEYSQAFLQNGGNLSTIMDIYFSDSLTTMRKKLESAEDQIQQQQSEQSERDAQLRQEEMAKEEELENRKLELEDLMNLRDNETKRYLGDLKELSKQDSDSDGIIDEVDKEKLNQSSEKIKNDKMLKIKQLNQDMKKHQDKMKLESKKLNKKVTK